MLKVQEFLRQYSIPQEGLDALLQDHGIHHKNHPKDGRTILDYDQIASIKTNPLVRECRGLVLDRNNNWELVAKGFNRFYNIGECAEEMKQFNWTTAMAGVKHDGSMILCYRWNGKICANTRFSFGTDIMNYGKSFGQLFFEGVGDRIGNIEEHFRDYPQSTLVFELTSPYNKIVRTYPKTDVKFLLKVTWHNNNLWESKNWWINDEAYELGFDGPNYIDVKNIYMVNTMIKSLPEDHEGFVLVDGNNNRWKIKSDTYVMLHNLKNNGNILLPKYAIPAILQGNAGDIVSKFPEMEEQYTKLENWVKEQVELCNNIYSGIKDIKDQKEFALTVKSRVPNGLIGSLMFTMRKTNLDALTLFKQEDCKYALKLWEETK